MICKSNQRGFGLVDILISLIFLTVGLFGFVRYLTHVDSVFDSISNMQTAVYLAENQLERLKADALEEGENGESLFEQIDTNQTTEKIEGQSFKIKTLVNKNIPIDCVITVELTVTWKDKFEQNQAYSIRTILSQPV